MTRRVLIVLEAGDAYPSGFVRGLIYKDWLVDSGFQVKFVNRLFPALMRSASNHNRLFGAFLATGFGMFSRRVHDQLIKLKEDQILRLARNYDVVYLSKAASLRLVSRLRRETRACLILDLVDALWLPRYNIAGLPELLSLVDAVTTDNGLTATYIRQFTNSCFVIPDCPQVEAFDRRRREFPSAKREMVTLGWVGSTATAYNLFVIWEALELVFAKYPQLQLVLVGVGPNNKYFPPFERVRYTCVPRYTQAEMIDQIIKMDIGLFPLQQVEASEARGILKATIYMAGATAVIASPVGQICELIQDGVNGMLARTTAEWVEKLEKLILDTALRSRIAQAGLQEVREQFTVKQSFEKLRTLFLQCDCSS